jgi:hypothetical protein
MDTLLPFPISLSVCPSVKFLNVYHLSVSTTSIFGSHVSVQDLLSIFGNLGAHITIHVTLLFRT